MIQQEVSQDHRDRTAWPYLVASSSTLAHVRWLRAITAFFYSSRYEELQAVKKRIESRNYSSRVGSVGFMG